MKAYFVVGYHSKSFGDEAKSYSPTELELLALDDSLDFFNSLLHGTKFTVVTDHENLIPLLNGSTQIKSKRVKNALPRVCQYLFDLHHIKGVELEGPDYFSRIISKAENNNKNLMNGKQIKPQNEVTFSNPDYQSPGDDELVMPLVNNRKSPHSTRSATKANTTGTEKISPKPTVAKTTPKNGASSSKIKPQSSSSSAPKAPVPKTPI
jgi:hypothetical protein